MSDVYPKDFHTLNGKKMKPNRFYDERFKKMNPLGFEKLKERRSKQAKKQKDNPAAGRLKGYHKDRYTNAVTKSLKRGYEND